MITEIHRLQAEYTTHEHNVSIPDNHAPTEFVHYLEEVRRSTSPLEDATDFVAASMKYVSKMERVTRQRLVHGYNKLGASTDNLRGIQHNEGPMRPCQCCKTLVTQRWAVQERTTSPLQPHQRYHNSAAHKIIHSDLLASICAAEPAITSTSLSTYTAHETTVREALEHTFNQTTVTHLCYSCATPAMLDARHHHSDTPPTITESKLEDYRAIFQGKPTALDPATSKRRGHRCNSRSLESPALAR